MSSFIVEYMFEQGNKTLFRVTNASGTSRNTITTQITPSKGLEVIECSCSNVRAQPMTEPCAHVRAMFS